MPRRKNTWLNLVELNIEIAVKVVMVNHISIQEAVKKF